MGQPNRRPGQAEGETAAGFESVQHLFQQQMDTQAEENAQLCVYYRGEKVVDLWASNTGDHNFSPDSLINVFSSGKSLEAIAIASLAGKGLLDYAAKISTYWPEFTGGGKEDVTVADLMRHEAGLAGFNTSLELEDLLPQNIKANRVGRVIEQQPCRYRNIEAGKREYHAMTRGWIANELYRRVDPAGRTIGEYLKEEVSDPLQADAAIGLSDEQLEQVSKITLLGIGAHILASLRPKFLGRKVLHSFFGLMRRMLPLLWSLRKGAAMDRTPPIRGMASIEFFNNPDMRKGETPSANAHCSARGLARVAAMMAAKGKLDGVECLDQSGWHALHQHPVPASMGGMMPTRFTQGGVDQFLPSNNRSPLMERAFNDGREGFYGWMGLGGSIFQWHPEAQIGFAFVPTSLHMLDFLNERGKIFQKEILKCVTKLD